jgi:acyl-CoA thioester hydrolase
LLRRRIRCESSRPVDPPLPPNDLDAPETAFAFSTDLSVRFSETDAQGIANNAVYLNWFEVARVAYLARFPGGYRGMIDQGVEATTVETYVRYRAPCRFDDRLRIHARVTELRGARFRFEYLIRRLSDPQATVADGWTAHATVDAHALRPTRVPGWLAEAIAAAESR